MRRMERIGLMSSRKEGRYVDDSVAEPHLESIMGCIEGRFG